MKLFIISCLDENQKFIEETINSLKLQYYTNFECFMISDGLSDELYEFAKKLINNDKRFLLFKNIKKKYKVKNIIYYINNNSKIKWNDVIIELDPNTQFIDNTILSYINKNFTNPNCWLLDSNWLNVNNKESDYNKPNPNLIRNLKTNIPQIRSYRTFLLRSLDKKNYTFEKKIILSSDSSILGIPMMEMCGIENYVYSKIPLFKLKSNVDFTNRNIEIKNYINSLTSYNKLKLVGITNSDLFYDYDQLSSLNNFIKKYKTNHSKNIQNSKIEPNLLDRKKTEIQEKKQEEKKINIEKIIVPENVSKILHKEKSEIIQEKIIPIDKKINKQITIDQIKPIKPENENLIKENILKKITIDQIKPTEIKQNDVKKEEEQKPNLKITIDQIKPIKPENENLIKENILKKITIDQIKPTEIKQNDVKKEEEQKPNLKITIDQIKPIINKHNNIVLQKTEKTDLKINLNEIKPKVSNVEKEIKNRIINQLNINEIKPIKKIDNKIETKKYEEPRQPNLKIFNFDKSKQQPIQKIEKKLESIKIENKIIKEPIIVKESKEKIDIIKKLNFKINEIKNDPIIVPEVINNTPKKRELNSFNYHKINKIVNNEPNLNNNMNKIFEKKPIPNRNEIFEKNNNRFPQKNKIIKNQSEFPKLNIKPL